MPSTPAKISLSHRVLFGWRLCLAALVVVLAALVTPGCHKIFGDFEVGPGTPLDVLCRNGELRCNEEYLLACKPSEDAWELRSTCATPDACDSRNGGCQVCIPGDLRCNLANREACADDGSGWNVVEVCESEAMCNPTSCGLCPTPGALDCAASGNSIVLRQCVQSTGWDIIDQDCRTEALCDLTISVAMTDPAGWMGACLDPACPEAGALSCEGATLRRCPQSLDTWMQVDICDTEALCQQTLDSVASSEQGAVLEMCNPGCSPAGSFFCDGQELQRCRDDQTGWDVLETCPAGRTCNPTLGECSGPCTPGEFRCNGANLESCGDTQEWGLVQTCQTQALCVAQQDETTLEWQGFCDIPTCGIDEHECRDAELWRCNEDRTAWVLDDTCATAALCEAENKRCRTPVCVAGARRCNPANPLELEECNADRTDRSLIETCAADEACNPTGVGPNCLKDCPDTPIRCLGAVREVCDDTSGQPVWYPDSTCATEDLCNCVLNDSCTQLTSDTKCGQAICGLNLPDFNCNGSVLEECDSGRNGWNAQQDCGASNLCDTGTNGDNGACLACPTAGEVQCFMNTSGQARRTCSADRSEWSNVQNCGFGCVDSGTSDYCAVCFANELRCDGGGDLDRCTAARDDLVDQAACQFGCLLNGNSDQCAACAAGESRCNGAQDRDTCDADRMGLSAAEDCRPYSCIDDGEADFCGECQANDKQCNGDVLQTCSSGAWGSDQTCMFACIPVTGGPDVCAPDCTPGVIECVSSNTAVRTCAADGTWDTASSCQFGCIDNGTLDFCAPDCTPGSTECISATQFRTCNAQGEWVSQPTNCGAPTGACYQGACVACNPDTYVANCTSGTNLRTCSSAGALVNTTCSGTTSACAVVNSAAGCYECAPGDTECADGTTLNTCNNSGVWAPSDCSPKICAENNGVTDCFECDGPSFECVGATDFRTCSESTGTWSMTSTCPNQANCSESLQGCEACKDNGKRCTSNNTKIQECSAGSWLGAMDCPGMVDCIGTYPDADCGVCQSGALQCSGNTVQECMSGAWVDQMACPALCRTGECVDCKASTHFMCDGMSDIFACNVTAGTWESASMSCGGFDCYGTEPDAYCGDCDPGDTSCNGNELLTCGGGGLWPMAGYDCGSTYGCFPGGGTAYCGECTSGAEACASSQESDCVDGLWTSGTDCMGNSCAGDRCGDCADGDRNCADASTLEICSAGAWGSTPCTSPDPVCTTADGGVDCYECVPNATTCTDDPMTFAGTLVTCGTDGAWGSGSACTAGMSGMGAARSCAGDTCGECLNDDQECRTDNNGEIRICANGAWGAWMACADANGCNGNQCAPPPVGTGGTGGVGGSGGVGGVGGSTTVGGMGGMGGATTTSTTTTSTTT